MYILIFIVIFLFLVGGWCREDKTARARAFRKRDQKGQTHAKNSAIKTKRAKPTMRIIKWITLFISTATKFTRTEADLYGEMSKPNILTEDAKALPYPSRPTRVCRGLTLTSRTPINYISGGSAIRENAMSTAHRGNGGAGRMGGMSDLAD